MSEPTPILVSAVQAARILGVSRASFFRHIADDLPRVYIGSLRRYPIADLAAWADQHATPPPRNHR